MTNGSNKGVFEKTIFRLSKKKSNGKAINAKTIQKVIQITFVNSTGAFS